MDAKQCRNPALLHIVRKRDYSLDLGKVAVIARLSQGERIGVSASGRQTHAPLHCLQQWFNLSNPAVEEALYDSRAMRCQGSPKCP